MRHFNKKQLIVLNIKCNLRQLKHLSIPLFANQANYLKTIVLISLLLVFTHNQPAWGEDNQESSPLASELTIDDCVKCHSNIVSYLQEAGESHLTEINCLDCHIGHPPRVKDNIPECQRCHKDREHFTLDNCLQCHTNPHTPLRITLTRSITYPCTTCHKEQIKELRAYPSIHTTLDCTACHTRHGYLPPCFNCHAPHIDSQTNDECQNCHKPHMPLEVTYPDSTPSFYCATCHAEVYTLLGESHAKHRNLPCAKCHEAKHKMIPQCTKCHGYPHDKSLIERFGGCNTCHGIAHNLKLNNVDMRLEQKAYLDGTLENK